MSSLTGEAPLRAYRISGSENVPGFVIDSVRHGAACFLCGLAGFAASSILAP